MAEVSNATGLGQDGYINYQNEAVAYGTEATGSEIDLPVKEGALFKAYPEHIENNNIVASRLKQDVNSGRIVVEGTIIMDVYPTLIGARINQFLGAATSAAVGDGAYTHYLFIPKTGVRIAKSATYNQAIGNNLADRIKGALIDSVSYSQDTSGNLETTETLRGQNYTEDIARETTWSYPSAATNPPFMFGHATITATPSGADPVTLCAESLSITINLNHKLDRYKVCSTASGAKISQPLYNSIPTVEISMNVESDQYFIEYARTHKKWDLVIEWTHTVSQAGTTPTYHKLTFELPACILSPDTEIPNSNDQSNMDLTFNCGYGGVSTSSGANSYMGEIRWVDETAAYT